MNIDLHLWIPCTKLWQQPKKSMMAIGSGDAEPQYAGRHTLPSSYRTLRINQLRQRLPALLKIAAPVFSQAHLPGSAHE